MPTGCRRPPPPANARPHASGRRDCAPAESLPRCHVTYHVSAPTLSGGTELLSPPVPRALSPSSNDARRPSGLTAWVLLLGACLWLPPGAAVAAGDDSPLEVRTLASIGASGGASGGARRRTTRRGGCGHCTVHGTGNQWRARSQLYGHETAHCDSSAPGYPLGAAAGGAKHCSLGTSGAGGGLCARSARLPLSTDSRGARSPRSGNCTNGVRSIKRSSVSRTEKLLAGRPGLLSAHPARHRGRRPGVFRRRQPGAGPGATDTPRAGDLARLRFAGGTDARHGGDVARTE